MQRQYDARRKVEVLNFLVRADIQQKVEVQNFGHKWGKLSPVSRLVANPDPPIKNTLGLITAIILKKMRESIFFHSNKFTPCKVADGKEVAKSLMIFNLR